MSRLGKLPIELNKDTTAKMDGKFLIVKGKKGELKQNILDNVKLAISEDSIVVSVLNPDDRKDRALWGLYRVLIFNMVTGVNTGFEKKLEINGVGYRAAVSGNKLNLNLGYSHPIEYVLPSGITAIVEKNVITISGIDKQLVGEVSAQIRKFRKPEPYKGKGIKYQTEIIRRKAGKSASK